MAPRIRAQTIGGGLGITPTSVAFYDVLSAGGTIAQMAVGGGLTGTWALINSSSSLVALSAGGLLTRGAGAATSGTPVVQFTSGSTILQVPITATVIVATLPANTVLPAISPSGTPVVGVTLTATSGTWTGDPTPTYAYQWRQVDTSTNISGATSATYTPVSGDVGHTLTCVVTATNIKGSASASAATTPAVISVPVAPVNTVAPGAPTGSAVVGGTLTAQNGTWTGNPTPTFAYAWYVNGAANGAIGSTYVPVSGDLGKTVAVLVTGSNLAGTPAGVMSAATAAIGSAPVAPSNTVAPAISGNPWPSSTLTVGNGTWAGNPTPTFTYQWKSGGTNIGGATSQTYKVASADLSAVITCAVTATNSQGSATATSASRTIVEVPVIVATPAAATLYVSEGDSITFGVGVTSSYSALFAATDTTDITFSNQATSGAQLGTLTGRASTVDALIGSNPGKSSYVLSVMIGTNDTSNGTYYPSGAATFLSNLATYLDARAAAGYTIVIYTITPRNDVSLMAWIDTVNAGLRNFVSQGHASVLVDIAADPIMGGITASQDTSLYAGGLHPTDRGDLYIERASAAIISGVMTTSVAPTVGSVTISGTATDGQTLTASISGVTGLPRYFTYAYQWKRNGSNISSATSATYILQPADVGFNITCAATATNSGGTSPAVTSNSLGPVAEVPVPTNSVAPVITGTATQGQTLTVSNNGTWSNSPTGYTYQWKRGGVSISSATSISYVLQLADVGANITCAVVASNNGGASSPATSNSLGPVAAANNFLLDAVSATAAAAYSTRKLKGAYAGSAIKVRRSSDNTTQDIGFDGSGNLDTAALATFVGANSGFIDTWYDQSGNSLDLTQATTANQPRIRNAGTTDTLNSVAAIRFGTSSGVILTRTTGFPTSDHSVAVVMGQATSYANSPRVYGGGGTAAGGHILYSSGGPMSMYYGGSGMNLESTVNGMDTIGVQASYIITKGSSGVAMLRSGGARAQTTATPTITSTVITVGNDETNTASAYQGPIPEFIIFSSALALADIKLVDASHSTYWGTTLGSYQDATMPVQTSNTAPTGYNAVFSSQFNVGTYDAFHAFDQSFSTQWAPTGATGYIGRQIPTAKTLIAYAVTAPSSTAAMPKTWTFEGSNDGSTWTTLATVSNEISWAAGERRVYPIASGSRGSYTYHRLNVSVSNNGANVILGEVEFITS